MAGRRARICRLVSCWCPLIRVGFINIFAVREWLGGLNYLRNLLLAVCALENRRIEPVFITGHGTDAAIASEFSFLPLVHTSALDRHRPLWLLRKLLTRSVRSDWVLQRLLHEHNIDILSHSGDLGRAARMRDDRCDQMRNTVVGREFDPLGVDHHAGRFSQQRGRKSQKSADCTAAEDAAACRRAWCAWRVRYGA